MASSPVHLSPDQAAFRFDAWPEHCVVFLVKTLYSHSASQLCYSCMDEHPIQGTVEVLLVASC